MSESTPPAFVLAVDIGGTKVDAAVVSATGALLRETLTRRPTGSQSDRAAIAASIRDAARTALAAAPLSARIAAIGVGSAGPIDLPTRTISPLNLPSARGLGIDDLLGDLLPGAPITLALDGTCIALAEHWLGALVGADDALALVVSTGIGAGFIAGGAPVRGRTGNAGHLGQVPVRTRDPLGGLGARPGVDRHDGAGARGLVP
ncbi:ROK family protein [Microbacterium sp. 18062]|uniref:ROK family protein n=1 Tax=Microbacterium sp. 18062 TaxID=2681410 RepID=UPI001F1D5988|nr:ROK family protein [Microbacterium sp. 18062]